MLWNRMNNPNITFDIIDVQKILKKEKRKNNIEENLNKEAV